MNRTLAALIASASLAACQTSQQSDIEGLECYLNVSYVRETDLSQLIWTHLHDHAEVLLNGEGFGASLWYSIGEGRAGFIYRGDCVAARMQLEQSLEELAQAASDPAIADALRRARSTIREVTQAQFEDSEPL
jgi:hypothetical protein